MEDGTGDLRDGEESREESHHEEKVEGQVEPERSPGVMRGKIFGKTINTFDGVKEMSLIFLHTLHLNQRHGEQLHYAAAQGDVLEISKLLDSHCDVNYADKAGFTALHVAIHFNKALLHFYRETLIRNPNRAGVRHTPLTGLGGRPTLR